MKTLTIGDPGPRGRGKDHASEAMLYRAGCSARWGASTTGMRSRHGRAGARTRHHDLFQAGRARSGRTAASFCSTRRATPTFRRRWSGRCKFWTTRSSSSARPTAFRATPIRSGICCGAIRCRRFCLSTRWICRGWSALRLLAQLRRELSPECMDFSDPDCMEQLALCDETLMERFLRLVRPDGHRRAHLCAACVPVLFSARAARRGRGRIFCRRLPVMPFRRNIWRNLPHRSIRSRGMRSGIRLTF